MDLDFNRDWLPKRRVLRGMFLGVLVALGLAFAYVYGGGMELLGNSQFTTVDGYAFTIAFLVGSLVPVSYFVYFRDLSEAAAIFVTILWSLYFGLEDLFVYMLLPDTSVPSVLPWLNDSKVGMLAGFLGFESVTRTALFVTIFVSFLGLLVLVKILEDFETSFLGVEV